jgi:hypothetical protein
VAKSELVDEIRDAYFKAHPAGVERDGVIFDFCNFVTDWLSKHGIQGMGMQASGLALRLADGRQLGLIDTDLSPTTADTPSVGINAVHREDPRRVLGDSPSFGITGR